MKPDLYTKTVLTIIAACLLVLATRSTFEIQKAHAASGPVEVNIVEIAGKNIKTKVIGGAEGALPITTGVDMIDRPVPIVVTSSRSN